LRTVLSALVVETGVDERSFGGLVRHELRWLRTIRAMRPLSYGLSFVTFTVPVAWLGCAISGGAWPAMVLLAVTALGRIALHLRVRGLTSGIARDFALLPLREALSLLLWAWEFVTRRVHWRDDRFHVTRDGSVRPAVRITP
jgi:ceramide glucosyltransferase